MSKAAELAKMGEVLTNSQVGGRRNMVINGAMQVAQRATSETGLGASAKYSTLDRFKMNFANTAGRLTMTQTADGPSGFKNCLKLACTTADTSIAAGEIASIQTRFEGQDLQQIKKGTVDAETITVSFYVKGNASATYTCELYDNDNSRHIGQEFSVTTSWTRVVLTFVADTSGALDDDNANSFQINWNLHAGSTYTGGTFSSNTWNTTANQRIGDNQTSFFDSTDRTFFITGVQMEIGSQATPFEHRSYAEELSLCERYFEVIFDASKTTGDFSSYYPYAALGHGYKSDQINSMWFFKTHKRIAGGTFACVSSSSNYSYKNHSSAKANSVIATATQNIEIDRMLTYLSTSSVTEQSGWTLFLLNSACRATLDTEL